MESIEINGTHVHFSSEHMCTILCLTSKNPLRGFHILVSCLYNVGNRAVHGGTSDALYSFLVEPVPVSGKSQEGHWAHSIWLVLLSKVLTVTTSLTNTAVPADSWFWGVRKMLLREAPHEVVWEPAVYTVLHFNPSSISFRIGRACR